MPGLPADVETAIEGLYLAFARYPLQQRIEASPIVDVADAQRRLHARPLRKLEAADLGVFAFKAMTTFGGVDDFRHFLPRIAELLSYGDAVGVCDLSLFIGKLGYGEWSTWSEDERGAVERWLEALEDSYFRGDSRFDAIDPLWDAALTRRSTTRFIDRWLSSNAPSARHALADALFAIAESAQTGRTADGPPLIAHTDRVRNALARACQESPDPHLRNALLLTEFPPFTR